LPAATSSTWILESGTYWASEGSVEVSATRERAWTSFWAGEGFIDGQTKVSGHGRVALKSQGRVEEVSSNPGERFVAPGKSVIARSREVGYRVARPTKSLLKTYFPGRATAGPTMGPSGSWSRGCPTGSFACWAATRPQFNRGRF
jgi:uncharacterized protein (AIM24 family)